MSDQKKLKKVLKRHMTDNMFLIFALFFLFSAIWIIVDFVTNPARESVDYVFVIVFPLISLILLVIAIINLVKNIKISSVFKNGKEYNATITRISEPYDIGNGMKRYAVYYSWIDEFGELLTGSSGNVYTKEETDIFLKRKILTIKVKRKMSVITSVPSEDDNDIQFSISHKLKHHVSYQKRILCDYCGSPITKRDERCPNCQSKINLYK